MYIENIYYICTFLYIYIQRYRICIENKISIVKFVCKHKQIPKPRDTHTFAECINVFKYYQKT